MGVVLLAAHQNMLKYVQGHAHMVWLGQCDGSVCIVPIQVDSNIDVCFHIECDYVFSLSALKNGLHPPPSNTEHKNYRPQG